MDDTPMILITATRHMELLMAETKLFALEGAGVDNWEGFEDAMESME